MDVDTGKGDKKWIQQRKTRNKALKSEASDYLCLLRLCWGSFGRCGADVPTMRTHETRCRSESSLVWGRHKTVASREEGREVIRPHDGSLGIYSVYLLHTALWAAVSLWRSAERSQEGWWFHFWPQSLFHRFLPKVLHVWEFGKRGKAASRKSHFAPFRISFKLPASS